MNLNPRKWLSRVDKKQAFIALLIFLLAFGVRAHLMKYELMFEFDTYFHARVTSYIIQDGVLPPKDPMTYYQLGGGQLELITPVFWFGTAALYKIFTLGAPYDKQTWIVMVKVLPAIFGALTAVAMFFLVKEMYNKKAACIAAVMAAVVPAFVYRTMAGFFEEDSLGFLWLLMGLYFFVKAVKPLELNRGTATNALIASLFFGLMAWTWEMFLLIPIVMTAYLTFTIITFLLKSVERAKIKAFIAIFFIAFLPFAGFATLKFGTQWAERSFTYVAQYLPITPENVERVHSRGEGILALTVGEESLGFNYFWNKYNGLIFFTVAALFIIPYSVARRKADPVSWLVFFYILVTLFMAYSKLKFTYTHGLPLALGAGVVGMELLEFARSKGSTEKKAILLGLGLMLLMGVGAGSFFVSENVPNIESSPGWKDAMNWARENLPKETKFFNWWDEGHWISFIAERKVLIDNRNLDLNADSNFAKFIISESEEEAYAIVKKYGSDYVIFGDDLLEKAGSMAIYAYMTTDFSDPRVLNFGGLRGLGRRFPCSPRQNPITLEVSFRCGPNEFTEEQFSLMPSAYKATPNSFIDQRNPVFIYKNKEMTRSYLVSPLVNKLMVSRLWFNDPALEHFEEVYSSGEVKIFKVIH